MKRIQTIDDERILQEIFDKEKVILFKNSMNCSISRNARGQMESFAKNCEYPVEIYMVDVINERELSKKIESTTGIKHESPQAIYMEKGKVIWYASHFKITIEELKNAIEK